MLLEMLRNMSGSLGQDTCRYMLVDDHGCMGMIIICLTMWGNLDDKATGYLSVTGCCKIFCASGLHNMRAPISLNLPAKIRPVCLTVC